jgi:hypothetical protein
MAIAGGATTAYACQVVNGALVVARKSTLRSLCVKVDEAFRLLGEGQRVTVAGADMPALRAALGAVTEEGPASLNEVVNEHYPKGWD